MLDSFWVYSAQEDRTMRWIKWAFGEALFRAVSMTLIKVIGSIAATVAHALISTLVIGTVQTVVAAGVLTRKGTWKTEDRRYLVGSVLFGVGAFVNTMIAFVAYMHGANIAVYTFLTLLAIIPGAFIDRMWFGEQLVLRQLTGIILAIVAGWLVLQAPDLREIMGLPMWARLGILNAVGLAINQGFTRWIKDVDPWIKNFWGGLTTFALCVAALALLGENFRIVFSPEIRDLLLWSGVIAGVVIGIWSFNVIAYRDGAAIPTKHVFVNGMLLVLTLLGGYVIFQEAVTVLQMLGMLMYLIAFLLVNNDVWKFLFQRR